MALGLTWSRFSPVPDSAGPYPPISDYGLIGDAHSCALVSRSGSIDWCCLPRFDSPSIFGRILDWENGGYFQVTVPDARSIRRRYLPETNILETAFETDSGLATLTDFMPVHEHAEPDMPFEAGTNQHIARILRCTEGAVRFSLVCRPRFDYGAITPYTALQDEHSGIAHGGAQGISLFCSADLDLRDDQFVADGRLPAGDAVYADVTYETHFSPSVRTVDKRVFGRWLNGTKRYWEEWAAQCTYQGADRPQILRSALTLKALTYAPSGALVAAPTTSLPERIGGDLNWDYRFTWIRDATFALYSLFILGFTQTARAYQQWLDWSTAGRARDLQLMYGLGGERRLTEIELPELDGYRGSRPVRIGNEAQTQFQLDIYGEVVDTAYLYQRYVGELHEQQWAFLRRVADFVLDHWREPDDGIWESRDGRQQHVYSKVMCWVALDRMVKLAQARSLPSDVDRWSAVRDEIRDEVLTRGYDADRGAFVQAYGSKELDASSLLLPLVRFIPAKDPRMRSTIAAIERELTSDDGLVYRNFMHGERGSEGTFLICSFWLTDNLIMLGEVERARALFDRLTGYANDLGLFSEEIDGRTGEMLGNFPQALTHFGHIGAAVNLRRAEAGRRRAAWSSVAERL